MGLTNWDSLNDEFNIVWELGSFNLLLVLVLCRSCTSYRSMLLLVLIQVEKIVEVAHCFIRCELSRR